MRTSYYLAIFWALFSLFSAPSFASKPTANQECGIQNLKNAPRWLNLDDHRLKNGFVVVVQKAKRRLSVIQHGKRLKSKGRDACWTIGLGMGAPLGDKIQKGDKRTPEGWYWSSDRPWSKFHGAITIHYPNRMDAKRGLDAKRITPAQYRRINESLNSNAVPPQTTKLGGLLLIHGGGNSRDWTLGCIAMNNEDIDDLRALLPRNKSLNILIVP